MKYLSTSKIKKNGGFTITEVLIVLAVAGLIMGVIFKAVPHLQRNTRDQGRRAIASRIRGEIETYASNHNGQYPFSNVGQCPASPAAGDWADLYKNYLNNVNLNDPSTGTAATGCGTNIPLNTPSTTASYIAAWPGSVPALPGSKGILSIITGASCNGSSVQANTGSNVFAIVIGLELSGNRFCIDNS